MGDHLLSDVSDVSDISDINIETYSFTLSTSEITDIMVKLAKKEELDIDPDDITSRRVGRILGMMRFINNRESGQGTRQWIFRNPYLAKRSRSHGMNLSDSFCVQEGSQT